MRSLALLVLCAAASSFTAQANNNGVYIQNDFGNSCRQDGGSGQSLTFGANIDPYTQQGNISIQYKMEIGQARKPINCSKMYNNSIKMEKFKLRKMEIELAILERKLANNKVAVDLGDDW